MASTVSYDVVGLREHLTSFLSTVSPEETPMTSGLPKVMSQKNPLMEWQTDDNEEVNFDGVVEGTDQKTFDDKAKNRVRLGNRYQELRRPYMVSNIHQNMDDVAGVPNEKSRAQSKSLVELKRDFESCIGSDQEVQAGSGASPSLLRALGKWIDSGNTNIDSSIRTPGGNIGTTSGLTESGFNDVLQNTYEQSGIVSSYRLYANTNLQRAISNFTRAEGTTTPTPFIVNSDQSSKEIIFSVQFYRGDFANVQVISDIFVGRSSDTALATAAKDRGYLITPEAVQISMTAAPSIFENTDEGGGPRGFAKVVATLVCRNPKHLGKFV